jgi:hypothetical protein
MYTIKILDSKDYDKLPYKKAKTSLGCADAEKGIAFVRKTGNKEWDMATLSHEVDELVAKVSPHEEDGIRYKDSGGSVETKVIEDPYKMAVTNPLSAYLASQVGKGTPRYGSEGSGSEGKTLYEPMDTKAYSTYQDFLNINPDEWYTKAVVEPTMKDMADQNAIISEGWAGSLRGSGRFRDLEDFTQDTASTLAEGRYNAELQIPQAQFAMAQSYSQQRNQEKALEYADWYQSLPENNPALTQALQFLAGNDGRDVITYQKQGESSNLGSVLGMVAGLALGPLTGGMSLTETMLAMGIGGSAGSLFD